VRTAGCGHHGDLLRWGKTPVYRQQFVRSAPHVVTKVAFDFWTHVQIRVTTARFRITMQAAVVNADDPVNASIRKIMTITIGV